MWPPTPDVPDHKGFIAGSGHCQEPGHHSCECLRLCGSSWKVAQDPWNQQRPSHDAPCTRPCEFVMLSSAPRSVPTSSLTLLLLTPRLPLFSYPSCHCSPTLGAFMEYPRQVIDSTLQPLMDNISLEEGEKGLTGDNIPWLHCQRANRPRTQGISPSASRNRTSGSQPVLQGCTPHTTAWYVAGPS